MDAKLNDVLQEKEWRKIIICTPDNDKPENWTSLFEISDSNKVQKAKEILSKAQKTNMPAWSERMKIITKQKKYIMIFQWDSKIAYGTDWVSQEFREFLTKEGFPEP